MFKNVIIKRQCWKCGKIVKIRVYAKDYLAWCRGEKFAQDAFPYLKKWKREMIISKTCNKCFDEMFPETNEEEIRLNAY